MRKVGFNLQRNTRDQFAAKCGGQIARNIQHYHRKLEGMEQGRGSFTYAGKITNRAKRYEAWEDKMNRADHLRFGALFSEIL